MREFLQRVLDRIQLEPVYIVTAAAIVFGVLSDQMSSGVDFETAVLAAAQALIGWLLREAVVPMRKVSSGEYTVNEPLPPPPSFDSGLD